MTKYFSIFLLSFFAFANAYAVITPSSQPAPIAWKASTATFPNTSALNACLTISPSFTGTPINPTSSNISGSSSSSTIGTYFFKSTATTTSQYSCAYSTGAAAGTFTVANVYYCPNSLPTASNYCSTVSCPANSTLTGATCTCNATYSELNGACVPDRCNQSPFEGYTTNSSGVFCLDSCSVTYATVIPGKISKLVVINGVPTTYTWMGVTYLRTACTGANPKIPAPTTPSPSCSSIQDAITINGSLICKDRSNTATTACANTTAMIGDVRRETETCITTNPDGSTSTKVSSKDFDAAGKQVGASESQTGTTPNANDPNIPNNAQSPFCQANPHDPSCGTPSDACIKNPTLLSCMKTGDTPTPETVPSSTRGLAFNPSSAPSGSCPAPVTVVAGGRSFVIEYQPVCDFASSIKPLILAFAYLAAAFIVFGRTE